MASAFITTPEIKESIRKCRAFAEDPGHWRRLADDTVVTVPGDISAYTVDIPVGYKAVYSVDAQGDDSLRHLSVSLHALDGTPKNIHPMVMMELMALYEFGEDAQIGTLPADPPWVVHALEVYDPEAATP
jgi:hypothetical protein